MKKLIILTAIFSILLFTLILATDGFNLFSSVSFNNLITYSYCDQPISYYVDTVDPKFNLSREDFSADTNQAASIWNKTWGKKLFVYDPKGKLSVNLIYDERQSLNSKINQLKNDVQSEKQSLNPKIEEYRKLSSDFKQKLDSLNSEIEHWNQRGGAPPDEYDKLIQKQQDLQTQANDLNAMAQKLNISTDIYNSQVDKLNKTIETFNNVLEDRPEEGLFDGPNNRIEIYFNINEEELIHTLAHEFGHALGIGHVNNPLAIMYFKTSQKIVPAKEDIEKLQEVCKRRSYIDLFKNNISEIIKRYNLPDFVFDLSVQ